MYTLFVMGTERAELPIPLQQPIRSPLIPSSAAPFSQGCGVLGYKELEKVLHFPADFTVRGGPSWSPGCDVRTEGTRQGFPSSV